MEFKINEGNIEKTYQVNYDKNKVKDLINKIIENCGYKEKGNFDITHIYDSKLPNGEPVYQNVIRKYYQGYKYFVEGTKVTSPDLAYILADIINEKDESFNDLANYQENPELISIDLSINYLKFSVEDTNNKRRIYDLKDLSKLIETKNNGQYFNSELLNNYYQEAMNMFSFILIKEAKIINDDIIIPFTKIKSKYLNR